MVQNAKPAMELIDKTHKITVIVCWVFMIQEIRLIVLHAFINVRHVKLAQRVFLAKEIIGKMFLIIVTV